MTFTFLMVSVAAAMGVAAGETDGGLRADSAKARMMDDVVVTGVRPGVATRLLPMSVSTITTAEIEAAHEPSLLPLLNERVPSAFVTGRGVLGYGVSSGAAGGIKIRGIGGSPTTGVLILIDGYPQYQGLMGHALADVCQSVWAERVEVVRGPASVLYGSNALGGVVNVVTRQAAAGDGQTLHAEASYGSYRTATASVAATVRRGRWSANASAAVDRTDGHRQDMGFEQATAFLKAACSLPRHWTVTVDGSITHFNASNPGPVTARLLDNDSHITRGTASIAADHDGPHVEAHATAYINWGEHHINDGYAPGDEPQDYRFRSRDYLTGLSAWLTAQLWRGARMTLGAEGQAVGGRAWNRYADGRHVASADTTAWDVAAYAVVGQRLGTWLSLDAGLRCDRHSACGTMWVPQVGATLRVPRGFEFRAIASRGFRYPSLRELYMWQSANPSLHAERLWSYETSVAWRRPDGTWESRVGVFYIDADELVETIRTAEGRPRNVNTGATRNRGVEVECTWRPTATVHCSTQYSYLHTSRPVLAAPRHKWAARADLRMKQWTVTPSVLLVAGLYTATTPRRQEENYWTMNLDVAWRVSEVMGVFAKGENLLAQKYEINAGYPMPRATVTAGINIMFH